jgi:long-chain acyl-CoA synthetase
LNCRFNINPIEVENLLYTLPGVKMCAVVGLPDAQKGEAAVAVVESIPPPG